MGRPLPLLPEWSLPSATAGGNGRGGGRGAARPACAVPAAPPRGRGARGGPRRAAIEHVPAASGGEADGRVDARAPAGGADLGVRASRLGAPAQVVGSCSRVGARGSGSHYLRLALALRDRDAGAGTAATDRSLEPRRTGRTFATRHYLPASVSPGTIDKQAVPVASAVLPLYDIKI